MESAKHGNSESSSDENDQQTSDDTGTGRSYECTFCKRGFTNAQALGGHMNIHRKDKAKAKQVSQDSSVSNKSNEDFMALKYFAAPISSKQAQYYAALGPQVNYQMYFPAVSNPSYLQHAPRTSEPSTALHEAGGGDANLSLQIGPPNMEDGREKKKNGKKSSKESEVDLELRLGHNP